MGFVPVWRPSSRRPARPPGWVRGRGSGAWRFENWIVDASERTSGFLSLLLYYFDRTSFLVLFVDRFVIISDVMICRLGIC